MTRQNVADIHTATDAFPQPTITFSAENGDKSLNQVEESAGGYPHPKGELVQDVETNN